MSMQMPYGLRFINKQTHLPEQLFQLCDIAGWEEDKQRWQGSCLRQCLSEWLSSGRASAFLPHTQCRR